MGTKKKSSSTSPRDRGSRLTPREIALVSAYQGSIAAAAKAIGMDQSNARKLMKLERVRQAIEAKNGSFAVESGRRLAKDLSVTVANVNRELARLAFSDPRRFFKPDGSAIPITELDDDTAMALAGFEVREITIGENVVGQLKKFKIADKGQNLERLGKILGMFIDRHLDLPSDWDSRTLEDQEYFAKHGHYPPAGLHGAAPRSENRPRPS